MCDKFFKIVDVWRYLKAAQPKDILCLPDIDPGDDLRNHTQLCPAEVWLIGFGINAGTSNTRYKVTGNGAFNRWKDRKHFIAANLYKIRHWQIVHGEFDCLAAIDATWFIDPPYKAGGQEYVHGIKQPRFYDRLIEFVETRRGQIIVCENSEASWLPFTPLAAHRGTQKMTTEVVYETYN